MHLNGTEALLAVISQRYGLPEVPELTEREQAMFTREEVAECIK